MTWRISVFTCAKPNLSGHGLGFWSLGTSSSPPRGWLSDHCADSLSVVRILRGHLSACIEKTRESRAKQLAMGTSNQISGNLNKFTNALRGFQQRYFILDPSRGTLEYYLPQDKQRLHPRGFIILSGAIVTPSEDDGQTFNVCSSSGEIYKLRATDSRERQFWVDRLRQVSQCNTIRIQEPNSLEISASSSFDAVTKILEKSNCELRDLESAIDGHTVGDHDLLRMKALAQASVTAMKDCYSIISLQSH